MKFRNLTESGPLSGGAWVITLIAVISGVIVITRPAAQRQGMAFWTFTRHHARMYASQIDRWNAGGYLPVDLQVIDAAAMVRRTLAGFWAQTPTADMIEVERGAIGRFVACPLDDVGFVDLTNVLARDGIVEKINPPSFSPWRSRGRVFGLPHDVHPVVLCYRADLVEGIGVDVGRIQTWDDFSRVMGPLIRDLDDDGRPDRYLLNLWYTDTNAINTLILQAGGGTFDANGNSLVACEANARVVATVVSWCVGPDRIAIDAPEFSPSGNQLRLDGRVIASLMPDWLAGVWMNDLPQLGGKLKLMPLPAWEPGGRRTSVWGGTMIGFPKDARHFDQSWAFATHLYLSAQLAEELFETNHIISPVVALWDEPFYDQPNTYFSGQHSGRVFIDQAPFVPERTSSPFRGAALSRIGEAVNALRRFAENRGIHAADALLPEARRQLARANNRLTSEIQRNVFLADPAP